MKSKKSKVFAVLAAAAVFTGVFAGCADAGTQENSETSTISGTASVGSDTVSAGTSSTETAVTGTDGPAILAAMQAAQEEQDDFDATMAMNLHFCSAAPSLMHSV